VRRGGAPAEIDATALVPGDLLLLTEGDRLSADARLIVGAVEVDMSPLTGESQPVTRSADRLHAAAAPLEAEDLVFAGTLCIGGDAQAVVYGTGMHTQLGRIAALSQAVVEETSPLQRQVNQAARLITLVAVGLGIAFFGVGYRQHPQVRHLHLRPLHTRDCAVPALCDVGGQHPSAADGAADPRDRPICLRSRVCSTPPRSASLSSRCGRSSP